MTVPPDAQAHIAALTELLREENRLLAKGDVHAIAGLLPRKQALVSAINAWRHTGADGREDLAAAIGTFLEQAARNSTLLEAAIQTQREIVTLLTSLPTRQDGYDAGGGYRKGGPVAALGGVVSSV